MENNLHLWQIWAQKLHRWGLNKWVASILEGFGPLTILGAQAIYMLQPFMFSLSSNEHLEALAEMLNDQEQTQAFTQYLREAAIE